MQYGHCYMYDMYAIWHRYMFFEGNGPAVLAMQMSQHFHILIPVPILAH